YFNLEQDLKAPLKGQPINNQEVWQLFGYMVHGVQDFYAHSTWVAGGHSTIVNFGSSISPGPSFAFLAPPSPSGAASGHSRATLAPSPATAAGYSPPTTPSESRLSTGQCRHGTLAHIVTSCASVLSTPPAPDGINHDTGSEFAGTDLPNRNIFLHSVDLATSE